MLLTAAFLAATSSVLGQAPDVASLASPLSPQESLKHFQLDAGLRIELVAAEPEVVDPVAMRFDEEGRLWVVEMRDYPHGPKPGEQPQSRIRILRDRDGDGRYETAVTFADHLLFATGVQPWKGGVFVTLAGRIAYMKDTNGDDKADVDETWFTGFAQENSQLRANHPRFAIDNHIYVANGLRGGSIVHARDPKAKPIALGQMDFRFDPLTGEGEAVSGGGQFGLTFDDYGNRFVCSNRNPVKHVVLEDRYLKRNPFLAVPAVSHDVAAAGDASRVFPISRAWTTSTLHIGQFTAACGLDIYRGDALPAEYYGNAFVCEPTGNLVHREIISPLGATFTSRPAKEGVEFLASPDEWFRPVSIEGGPDGALYVVDMYRAVIEHPEFVPDELKNRPDLRLGDDRGRIYRIVSKGEVGRTHHASVPWLAAMRNVFVSPFLQHRSAWWRETAARLVYEAQAKNNIRQLEVLTSKAELPETRLAALWALAGLDALTPGLLSTCLQEADNEIRRHAFLLSRSHAKEHPDLQVAMLKAANDQRGDASFRFQAALSLGVLSEEKTRMALSSLALHSANDRWTGYAVATAVPTRPGPLLNAILSLPRGGFVEGEGSLARITSDLGELVGARKDPEEIAAVLRELTYGREHNKSFEGLRRSVLLGMAQALKGRGGSLWRILEELQEHALIERTATLFSQAADDAANTAASEAVRKHAVDLLAYARYELAGRVLSRLVKEESSQDLRLSAIEALAAHRDPSIAPLLLAGFATQTPTVRRAVLDAVLATSDRAKLLLDEIEAKRIVAGELDRVRADRLVKHADAAIRQRAVKLLADSLPADRKKVLDEYQSVLTMTADATRGREVFQKNCSTCHRIAGIGVDVAPDIADSRRKTPEQILVDVLQPNRAIDSNYVNYVVATRDGSIVTGVISADTASSITIRQPENKTVSLLRQDIEEIRSTGLSLMPEGLEKNIDRQQMADLIGFIKNWRYLDGRTPLGKE